jgi:hypothetical protein
MIIHGIGGIGKTRLCERFHKIAVEGVSRDRYEVIRVDWADIRTLDPGLGRAALFEAALDELERECSRNGKIASYFEQFRQLRVRLARVRAQVEPMGSGLGGDTQPDTALGRSAKLAGSVLQTGEVFGVPPGVGEAAQAAGAAVDALSAMWKNGESWLRNRLAPEDYELLVRPLDLLAGRLCCWRIRARSSPRRGRGFGRLCGRAVPGWRGCCPAGSRPIRRDYPQNSGSTAITCLAGSSVSSAHTVKQCRARG